MRSVAESLPPKRRPGEITARFRRAAERLTGVFFALQPGARYLTDTPQAVSLARILSVPNDELLFGLMKLDNGNQAVTRFTSWAKARDVTIVRYSSSEGQNTDLNKPIIWYSFGPSYKPTPADQLRVPFRGVVPDADLAYIVGAAPKLMPRVVRGPIGDRPSHVLVEIWNPDTNETNKKRPLSDDEDFALASLASRKRLSKGDFSTLTIRRRHLYGQFPCPFVHRPRARVRV